MLPSGRFVALTPRRLCAGLAAGSALLILGGVGFRPRPVPTAAGALPQQAYLWQRQWTASVRDAAAQADGASNRLAGLCVAYAEVGSGVDRVSGIDWPGLARARKPVGFAIRVHEFPGEVSAAREPFPTLRRVVGELCGQASAAGLRPAEIQIDFDCPTARLGGFAGWLRALQAAFPEQRFCFTALPSWLRSRDFPPLARTTGGFILQLHGLARPGPDGRPPATLCDPAQARAAVERAARVGVAFRVALPTYGYGLVLDVHGKWLAAAGEGVALEDARPPAGGTRRTLMADPLAMADLIREWQTGRPRALQGVIWYRLPVAGDRLNWTPRTLWAVMAGRRPQPGLALQFDRAAGDGPCELRLRNDGEADAPLPASIAVRCASVPVAADGVGGFEVQPGGASARELVFSPLPDRGAGTRGLPAGGSLLFGWVRLAGSGASGLAESPLTGSLTAAVPAEPVRFP